MLAARSKVDDSLRSLPDWTSALVVLLTCAFSAWGQDPAEQSVKRIRAGVVRSFPPQYGIDRDTGLPTGFAIDVMDRIAESAGIEIQYVVHDDWPAVELAIREGAVDLIPNMGITPGRRDHLLFTAPVETFSIGIFVRASTSDIQGVADLRGRRVSVVRSNHGVEIAETVEGTLSTMHNSPSEALMSLLSGNTDALLYPIPVLERLARSADLQKHIKLVGPPMEEVKRAIAVTRRRPDLLDRLDAQVRAFVQTAEYQKLYEKWYGEAPPFWDARKVALIMGAVLVVAVIGLAAWRHISVLRLNITLRKTIEGRRSVEAELRSRDAILEAVSFAAERFLATEHWEACIPEVLERLGTAAEASRVYIYEKHSSPDGRPVVSHRYEWVSPGVTPLIDDASLQNLDFQQAGFGRWEEIMHRGEAVHGLVNDFPESERPLLQAQSVLSLVVVPISSADDHWGFMGFDECIRKRVWSRPEIDALKVAAGILGGAIQRGIMIQRIKRGEERLRLITDHVPDYIVQLDRDGRITYANRAGPDVRMDEVLGQPIAQWLDGDHLAVFQQAVTKVLATGQPTECEVMDAGRMRPGRWFTCRIAPVREGNAITSTIVIAHDVTDRKRAEERLRKSEARFRTVFENAGIGIVIADREGKLVAANAAFQKLIGRDEAELERIPFTEYLHPDEVEESRRLFAEMLAGKRDRYQLERRYVRKDGVIVCGRVNASRFPHHPGGREVAITTIEDISESKRTSEELAQYREHLEELVERRTRELADSRERLRRSERLASIGTFAAGIAHEINNPIGGILLAAENALRHKDSPPENQVLEMCLQDIVDSSRRCQQITQSVLQFARQQRTDKWPTDVNMVIRRAVNLLETYAREKAGTISLDLARDMPSLVLNAVEIEQLVVNLIRNALEAGPAGIEVLVRTEPVSGGARIIVQDNGRGISEEDRAHLFDPFFTTRREKGGTGLGLSIVHGIVIDHGGTIEVESGLGRGTRFIISLGDCAVESGGQS